jgi:putative nucleotidyltransferase with HDIG domain
MVQQASFISPSRIVRKIEDLPTLPRTVMKITELVNNPKSSAKDLARVITEDQVLTARLLRLVNSSFYGFPQKISTVTGAIVLLGFDAIRNLLLTTSVFDMFAGSGRKSEQIQEQLWDHSLGCAVSAKVIGSFTRYEKIEELFVAGLLHDIGKIVEMIYMPTEYEKVTRLAREEKVLIAVAEERIFNFTHARVGQLLAKRWNLPNKLESIIAYHHHPEKAGRFSLEAGIIQLADLFCRALMMGSGGDQRIPSLNQNVWKQVAIGTENLGKLMAEIEKEYRDIRSFLTNAQD